MRKQIEHPKDVSEGFVDYVIALANDELQSANFTDEIMSRIIPEVDSKYRAQVQEKLKTATDGFIQTPDFAIEILLDVTSRDVKRSLPSSLFRPGMARR